MIMINLGLWKLQKCKGICLEFIDILIWNGGFG